MITYVFDPAIETEPLAVRVDPGRIIVGLANFIEPRDVRGFELSPYQAAALVIALTDAIEAERLLSISMDKSCGGGNGFDGLAE